MSTQAELIAAAIAGLEIITERLPENGMPFSPKEISLANDAAVKVVPLDGRAPYELDLTAGLGGQDLENAVEEQLTVTQKHQKAGPSSDPSPN